MFSSPSSFICEISSRSRMRVVVSRCWPSITSKCSKVFRPALAGGFFRLLQQDSAEVVFAVAEVVEIVPQIPEVLLFPGIAALEDGDLEEPVVVE